MKKLAYLFTALVSLNTFAAVIELGENVPEMCWQDAASQDVCLGQFSSQVRVLIYNTGWCPSCNEEFQQLVSRLSEVDGLPVAFFSLSAQGFTSAVPDAQFLKEWKEKHHIPFPVLASPKDPGKKFFEPPYSIPSTVIMTRAGTLTFKKMGAEVDEIFTEVKKALEQP